MAGAWKKIARNLVLPLLYQARVFDLLARCARRPFVIVMYHGVHPGKSEFHINSRHVTAAAFEEHLRFFARNFEVVSLVELAEQLKNGAPMRGRKLAITFDDGYRNNLTAAGMARKHRIPLTLFVGTSVVQEAGRTHYADELDFMILATGKSELHFEGQRLGLTDVRSRRAAVRAVSAVMKREDTAGKARILQSLSAQLQPEKARKEELRDFFDYLTERDLQVLGENEFVEVGSHSVEHHNLDHLSPEACEHELRDSREYLERVLGRQVTSFSYPDGSYNAEVRAATARYYSRACAVNPRLDRSGRDVYELPRLGFSSDDTVPIQMLYLVRYVLRRG